MQTIAKLEADEIKFKYLPNPDEFVMPNIKWGRVDELLTPAYWATQAWLDEDKGLYCNFRIGKTLKEEITACILGGYGITAELGLIAFARIRDRGYLADHPPTRKDLLKALREPFAVDGRRIHYRFAKQKSHYLSEALNILSMEYPRNTSSNSFRNWLLKFKGIGPKTASWITRNWMSSDEVAIIDVHIHRAGLHIGIFQRSEFVNRNYFSMEVKFLKFAAAINVRPSILDAMMWSQMRRLGRLIFQ